MEDLLGVVADVPYKTSLNIDSISYDIMTIGNDSKNLLNNGIIRDGGLTEVYQKTNTIPNAPVNSLTHYTSSGKRLYVDDTNQKAYIDDKPIQWDFSNIWFSKGVNLGYFDDAVLSTTNTIICLKRGGRTAGIYEYDYNGNLLNSSNYTISYSRDDESNYSTITRFFNGNTFANSVYISEFKGAQLVHINLSTGTEIIKTGVSFQTKTIVYSYLDSTNTKPAFMTADESGVSALYCGNLITTAQISKPTGSGVNGCYLIPNVADNCYYMMSSAITYGGASLKSLMSNSSWGVTTSVAVGPPLINPFARINCPVNVNAFGGIANYTGTDVSDSFAFAKNGSSSEIDIAFHITASKYLFSMDTAAAFSNISFTLSGKTYSIGLSNANGSPSFFTLSNLGSNSTNIMTEFGSIDKWYTPMSSNIDSKNRILLYKDNNGSIKIIKIGEISFTKPIISEIDPDVLLLPISSNNNIYNSRENKFYFNFGAFTTTSFMPVTTITGSYSVNVLGNNKYSSMVDFGKIYNGCDSQIVKGYILSSVIDRMPISYFENGLGYPATNNGYSSLVALLPKKYIPPLSYVQSSFNPIPAGYGYDFRNGLVNLDDGSAVGKPGMASYVNTNFLTQIYRASFRLFGQLYVYDGVYIYNLPLSAGSDGTVGTPIITAYANGLRFLCQTPKMAIFVSEYDNSLYTFNGGRDVDRLLNFNKKPIIRAATYCVGSDELALQCADGTTGSTEDSIMLMRGGFISEYFASQLPWALTSYQNYQLQSAANANWIVNNATGQSTAFFYEQISGSTIVPLNVKTGFYGLGSNRRMHVNRIIFKVLYSNNTPSQLNLSWEWIAGGDGTNVTGTSSATITPVTDSNGYAIIDWVPPNASVLGGAIGLSTADQSQKIVLLAMTIYYGVEADGQTINHAM